VRTPDRLNEITGRVIVSNDAGEPEDDFDYEYLEDGRPQPPTLQQRWKGLSDSGRGVIMLIAVIVATTMLAHACGCSMPGTPCYRLLGSLQSGDWPE